MSAETPIVGQLRQRAWTEQEVRDAVRQTVDGAEVSHSISAFHYHFYHAPFTWAMARYRGVPILKAPTDIWTYHELMHTLQPSVVIETGTAFGGSALLFADQPSVRKVITIDVEPQPSRPFEAPIAYLEGSSTDPAIYALVKSLLLPTDRVMVVLDSNHHRDHVLQELALYAPLVTPEQLLVVEDTNLAQVGVSAEGPEQALDHWLPLHPEFAPETYGERYLLTFNTWLRRRA